MERRLDPGATYLAISDRERRWDPEHAGKASAVSRLAGLSAGAAVVDVGAGQGWIASTLAATHDVTAVEPDRALRHEAIRRVRRGRRVDVRDGAAAALPVPSQATDLVVSVGSSLGYGTVEDDVGAFEEMRRILKPSAPAVVETMSADGASRSRARTTSFPDGTCVTYAPWFDAGSQVLRDRQRFRGPNVGGSFAYSMRTYDPGDLLTLARWSGLSVVGVFGGFDRRRWRPPDPIVMVVRAPLSKARSVSRTRRTEEWSS